MTGGPHQSVTAGGERTHGQQWAGKGSWVAACGATNDQAKEMRGRQKTSVTVRAGAESERLRGWCATAGGE
jgi:hypothetical protein